MLLSRLARFGQIVGAHGLLYIFDLFFDYALYFYVVHHFGAILGGVIMTVLATIVCVILLITYEKGGKDWLGVDVVEGIKQDGYDWVQRLNAKSSLSISWFTAKLVLYLPSRMFLVVIWLIKRNDVVAFFTLSIFQDAFKTTVFLRHGRFDGLKKRDWLIFIASIIVSNTYWTIRTSVLLSLAKLIF